MTDFLITMGILTAVSVPVVVGVYLEDRKLKREIAEREAKGYCVSNFAHCFHHEEMDRQRPGCELPVTETVRRWFCCKCSENGPWERKR